jgi:nucleotide-binding universal stress UspA family protein
MYEEILVPLDGSVLAEAALPHARALAKAFDGRITLITVFEPATVISQPGMVGPVISVSVDAEAETAALREYLDKIAANLKTEGIDVRTAIREGDAASAVIDYAAANREDIIVMSTHGRSGIQRWVYGSVADKVLRSANVPVLLIRAHAQG